MTHLNHQTNGASLEDCHTNFFALTDLCGIKWRKLVWGGSDGSAAAAGVNEPLDDPVLSSYSRCLAADILCVWRRVAVPPPQQQQQQQVFDLPGLAPPPPAPPVGHPQAPPLSLAAAKELWIFWYGEEPDLSELVASELITPDGEQGSWESGLSYECRSLLFKALHNLIERCLLSRDFVKLGKWFVQPYNGSKKISGASTTHLSFSFAFFVHGESTVCASVDVRRHPAVRRLSKRHLVQTQTSPMPQPVILAPFGLAGVLTGQAFRAADWTARLLEDWKRFFPLEGQRPAAGAQCTGTRSEADAPPPVVEVIVGGIKMRYPSCYVLVTDMDDDAIPSPPASPVRDSAGLAERAWQDCIYSCGGPTPPASVVDQCTTEESESMWEFVDPLKRANCSCSKCRKLHVGPQRWSRTNACSGGGGKSWSASCRKVPFHRRSPPPPLLLPPHEPLFCTPIIRQPHLQQTQTGGRCTPQGGPPSYPRNQTDSLPAVQSVGSPPSAAPSPLVEPHSQQRPPSSSGGAGTAGGGSDQTMPTLSPQQTPQAAAQHSTGTMPQVPTPTPPASEEPGQIPSIPPAPTQVSATSSSCETTQATTTSSNILKRPILTVREYETALLDEEQPLELLYDYTTLTAWLDHPVKRFKPDSTFGQAAAAANRSRHADLYSMGGGIKQETPDAALGAVAAFIKQEIKQEPNVDCAMDTDKMSVPGMKRPGDPYEFEEHDNSAATGNAHMDNFKRTGTPNIKEEPGNKDSGTKCSSDLFTTEGLQASFKDLDQIFDNSDDTSGDEGLQVQTPPGSNKSVGMNGLHDDNTSKRIGCHSGNAGSTGILRPEELSKMFPTPPSMEHNPVASPCGQLDGGPHSIEPSEIKQEIYPLMGSPRDEPIDDWSYVFRPPAICRMVGSSKYAPLTNLPSQSLPPVTVPSHCVYKPSWRKQQQTSGSSSVGQQQTTTQTQQQQQPSVTGTTVGGQQPVSLQQRARPLCASVPPPPPPYEMPSPAPSTASSYLNKTLNSVEPATPSLGQRQPEADSLLVNILLADTALNIFRDHNFDSCTLCVCNAGPKVVGNIRGADASTYLVPAQPPGSPLGVSGGGYSSGMSPPRHASAMSPDDDPIRCSCGFSAVVNRRLSHRSGLFYEDEMEITGIAEDPGERKKGSLVSCLTSIVIENKEQLDLIPQNVIETVREQCVIIQSNSNSLCRAAHTFRGGKAAATPHTSTVNVLEFTDGNEITGLALEGGGKSGSGTGGALYVHRWPFLRAAGPHCNQDIVRVMHCLQPLLQDAIQKKCTTRLWEAPYTVKGPLTWRQFHRLAGRGTDDRCEPQPVPSLVVGHDKDWLSLSPYALQHWDKLLLEPYSYSRDVAYVVVAPDSEAVLPRVKAFFRELSAIYEVCKLGRHAPITKALRDSIVRDGILRVGKTTPSKQTSEAMDEWFAALPDTAMTEVLKLYAQACRHQLAPHLCQVPMDKTLLEPESNSSSASPMSAPPLPSSNSNDAAPSTPKNDSNDSGNDPTTTVTLPQSSSDASMHDDDELSPPAIVIYLVEPFTMGTDKPELQRLACLALLRCFTQVIQAVPDNVRQNVHVQLVSQESIVELTESRERARHGEHMRALAFSVFSQCRRLLVHTSNIKSLTGFGTAAMADLFLKGKDEKNRAPYKLYTPPYILAPLKERAESAESFGQACAEDCSVLYISYCLSEDQSWLLAAATDERGEILETVTVNVDVPNRSRRRKASARRIGLQRLMDWILGVMSQSVRPWRLVVGRVGRIGHGELKGWSWLLSKKSLLKASKHLKELCGQCSLMYPSGVPCLLSACLVSLEPDSALRLMADQFTPDERFSQASVNCQLSTPADVSCTHILVFPTSATTQSSQTAFQEQHINGPELGDCELFEADILNDDMTDGIEGMNDFSDIFSGVWTETGPGGGHSPGTSPRRDGCNSPTGGSPGGCGVLGGEGDRPSPFPCDGGGGGSGRGAEHIMQEEVGTLLQQPLALGYLVSTAPTGRMPGWFWAQCPHLEHVCPVFLKNALHLHSPAIQQNSDDLLQQQSAVTVHPLDSQYTTDVLRYVLEGYNALSWLAIDSNTHDRRSCLPVHIQVLMQLYHMTAALL